MSAHPVDHAEEVLHAHDPAEEIAHAKQHAVDNMKFFGVFFFLILCAVAYYEFYGTSSTWIILALGAARSALIAGFLVWLMGSYSFILRTIMFTVFFFGGMVVLSIVDSDLPSQFSNPIKISRADPAQHNPGH